VKTEFSPIGIIQTPFQDVKGMPIQPSGAKDIHGQVMLDEKYTEALSDLEHFSHIILLYHFHRSDGYSLKVKPFLDKKERGLFSTRAPRRPNPIGLSVVRLKKIKGNILYIKGIDVLDQTPLLDIKPYVPKFDSVTDVSLGWLEGVEENAETLKADERFQD